MRAMRARLMLKLISTVMMLVLTVVGAHSCSSSPATSPLNPATVEGNGLAGLCANQAATAAASGDGSPQTLQIPAAQQGLSSLAGAAGLSPGSFNCPTTTGPGGS